MCSNVKQQQKLAPFIIIFFNSITAIYWMPIKKLEATFIYNVRKNEVIVILAPIKLPPPPPPTIQDNNHLQTSFFA
ncbi:hypothetical protein DERP_010357 [Dermatophagoides pteronyssinus]|uniref:Uncharacterized protein n=1 Tax=Dermatophagoides pteronyssinus TaxID=6956 RepID=A0ABQ8IYW6_DERPT|nr:hypothetical protein DERP_010357 [Dermatophagoides pteronyssinus]